MSIKQALAKHLLGSNYVRDKTNSRVYFQRAPQGTKLPYVTLRRFSTIPYNDIEGEAGCKQSVIGIAVFSDSDDETEAIQEAIRNRISGYRGPMGDLTCYGCNLESGPHDGAFDRKDGSDNWTFASNSDYRITHSQPLVDHK